MASIDIGKNIAKYRKRRHMTQEELGAVIGVSNQAVSKWELQSSLPDVTLLPDICQALGITLDALYGMEQAEPPRIAADDFPQKSYENLFRLFMDNSKLRFERCPDSSEAKLAWYLSALKDDARMLLCISDTAGATFISESFSFVDSAYKSHGSEDIFTEAQLAKLLTKLADKNLRRVLAFLYRSAFERSKNGEEAFRLPDIMAGTDLDEAEAADALDLLSSMEITVPYTETNREFSYIFNQSQALYALAVFRCAALLERDKVFLAVRDTKMILDYCFWE